MDCSLNTTSAPIPSRSIPAKSVSKRAKGKVDLAKVPSEALPFVSRRQSPYERPSGLISPLCFWDVEHSGDAYADASTGRTYADQAIEHMRSERFTPLLGWILADMATAGVGSMELAFIGRIASRACQAN